MGEWGAGGARYRLIELLEFQKLWEQLEVLEVCEVQHDVQPQTMTTVACKKMDPLFFLNNSLKYSM